VYRPVVRWYRPAGLSGHCFSFLELQSAVTIKLISAPSLPVFRITAPLTSSSDGLPSACLNWLSLTDKLTIVLLSFGFLFCYDCGLLRRQTTSQAVPSCVKSSLPLELFVHLYLLILSLCMHIRSSLATFQFRLKSHLTSLPITSIHPHASASNSTCDFRRYNICVTLTYQMYMICLLCISGLQRSLFRKKRIC